VHVVDGTGVGGIWQWQALLASIRRGAQQAVRGALSTSHAQHGVDGTGMGGCWRWQALLASLCRGAQQAMRGALSTPHALHGVDGTEVEGLWRCQATLLVRNSLHIENGSGRRASVHWLSGCWVPTLQASPGAASS